MTAPGHATAPSPALVFEMLNAHQRTAALRPGGRVAALEFVPNEDRVSPPMAAAFSMMMLASTASGDAYTLSELAEMYRQAGFGGTTGHPVPHGPHTVVVGFAQ